MSDNDPLLRMRGIGKRFPGVLALDGVSFELRRGEVHALVGENGAGKSTLMKILTGCYPKDRGGIFLRGERVEVRSPLHAKRLGIAIIHQELNLVPKMSVAENVFVDFPDELCRFGTVRWKALKDRARGIFKTLGLRIDLDAPVGTLGIAMQQMVEVAKALALDAEVLVMDEPTSALTDREIDKLFETIADLKERGVGIAYISHRMEELTRICDRATVLRDGKLVGTAEIKSTKPKELIRMMVGRELGDRFPKERGEAREEVLRVKGLTRAGSFRNVSFSVRAGEIVGMAGLVGAGRTEVARAVFGADALDGGEIHWLGRKARIRSPLDAIRLGIAYLPEDRKSQGLVLGLSVRDNISVTMLRLGMLSRWGVIDAKQERRIANRCVKDLRVKTPHLRQAVRLLSGGNQQKVVLAKWMSTKPRLIIFDEPTRGVDVGARVEVYQLMRRLAREGVAILMISSELPEVLGMSDRVLVMHEGRLTGEVPGREATEQRVMELAVR